jgi:hypothetical protein
MIFAAFAVAALAGAGLAGGAAAAHRVIANVRDAESTNFFMMAKVITRLPGLQLGIVSAIPANEC